VLFGLTIAVQTPDTSALGQFSPNAGIVRTIGLDTSVLEPGHFGTRGVARSKYVGWTDTARVEREPITRV